MSLKSSKGRDAGKELEVFRSTSAGQGIGGGGGGDAGPTPITASGGTKTTFPSWVIHEFTGPGTFSVDSGTGFIHLLLVAGGSGGSPNRGGGGGAGGALHRCNIPVTPSSSYPVSIGNGGSSSSNGDNSTFGPTFTAYGGASARGSNSSSNGSINIRTIPAPLSPQGQGGGGGSDPSAGGGGGAGTPGVPNSEPHPVQNTSAGGRGIIIDAIPTAYGDSGYFAGGGGGGGGPFSDGGLGGGGDSPGTPYDAGAAGTANTGGGGGGGADGGSGGNGGSGVCIVYYEAP